MLGVRAWSWPNDYTGSGRLASLARAQVVDAIGDFAARVPPYGPGQLGLVDDFVGCAQLVAGRQDRDQRRGRIGGADPRALGHDAALPAVRRRQDQLAAWLA